MKFRNNLSTEYAGLQLKTPIVVASSGLTNSVNKLKVYEQAGAGAVVLKSIFEEQMENEAAFMAGDSDFPEAMDYLRHYVSSNALDQHIRLIEDARANVSIPIVASINCYRADTWVEYATRLVEAGASALELNVMRLDADATMDPGGAEMTLLRLVSEVVKEVEVPVTVKLSKYFANVCALARSLKIAGVKGVVLFNRLYTYRIDVESETLESGEVFTSPADLADPLRFTALVRGQVPDLSLAISSGVRTGDDVIRCLLCGADVAQLCTAIYKGGEGTIREALERIDQWMTQKKYYSVSEFKSRLAATKVEELNRYLRAQFMKYFATDDHTPVQTSVPPKIAPDPDYQLER